MPGREGGGVGLLAARPGIQVAEGQDLRWVDRSDLPALGIPAPIRSLLESAMTE